MTKFTSFNCGLLALATGLFTTSALAQIQTVWLGSTESPVTGRYTESGEAGRALGSDGFETGFFNEQASRNFFIFNRTELAALQFADVFQSARLEITLPGIDTGIPYYLTANGADTGALFSLYKFEGDVGSLRSGVDGVALFDDLGADAGGSFGSQLVTAVDAGVGAVISVDLGAYFLDYLRGVTGEFALGGALSDPDAAGLDEVLFLQSDSAGNLGYSVRLRLDFQAVPEPSTYGLIGAGALALLAWRRRATKVARKG